MTTLTSIAANWQSLIISMLSKKDTKS